MVAQLGAAQCSFELEFQTNSIISFFCIFNFVVLNNAKWFFETHCSFETWEFKLIVDNFLYLKKLCV